MGNQWGIPKWLETEVKARDKYCIYCGVRFCKASSRESCRKTMATWEHIINDTRIVTRENIARCCVSCNSSKGTKLLADWMRSDYCKKKGINQHSVADIVKKALRKPGLSP